MPPSLHLGLPAVTPSLPLKAVEKKGWGDVAPTAPIDPEKVRKNLLSRGHVWDLIPDEDAAEHLDDLDKSFTPAQLATVFASRGLAAWPLALQYFQDPDEAFRRTLGRDLSRDEKTHFYAKMLGVPKAWVRNNFEAVEKTHLFGRWPDFKKNLEFHRSLYPNEGPARTAAEEQQLRWAMQEQTLRSLANQPDMEARIRTYADAFDLPVEEVRANWGNYELDAQLRDLQTKLREFPRTHAWLAKPENFRVASDSARHLTQLEGILLSKHGDLAELAWAQTVTGAQGILSNYAAFGMMIGDFTGQPKEEIEAAAKRRAELRDLRPVIEVGGLKGFLADVPAVAMQWVQYAALLPAGPAAPLIAIGAQEAGNVYGNLREQDANRWANLFISLGVGAANAYLEKLQFGKSLNIARRVAGAKGQILSSVGGVVWEALQSASQELAQNVVTELGMHAGEYFTPEGPKAPFLGRMGEAVRQGVYEGGLVAFTFPLLGGTMAVMSRMPGVSHLIEEKAWRDFQKFLEKTAAESPLGKRDPDAAEDHARKAAEDSANETVSLRPKVVKDFFQSNGGDAAYEDFLEKLEIDKESFERTGDAEREFDIPLGKWLRRVSDNPNLTEAMRKMSAYRIGEHLTEEELKLAEENHKIVAEAVTEALYEAATKKTMLPDELRAFQKKLRDSGVRQDDAEAITDLLKVGLKRLAELQGMTLDELSQHVNLRIVFGQDAEVFLKEQGHEMPEEGPPRGAVSFTDDGTIIRIFANKGARSGDLSTILHEIGHIFHKQLEIIAGYDAKAAEHLAALNAFAKSHPDGQEGIVKAWEAYLREGKAPTVELTGAFNRFRRWLRGVYKFVRMLLGKGKLNPEVRSAFDFMLATEQDLITAEAFYGTGQSIYKLYSDVFQKQREQAAKAKERADEKRAEKAEEEAEEGAKEAEFTEKAAEAGRGDEEAEEELQKIIRERIQTAEEKLRRQEEELDKAREKAFEKMLRDRLRWWKRKVGGRAGLKRRAGRELQALPVYKALAAIKELQGIHPDVLLEVAGKDGPGALIAALEDVDRALIGKARSKTLRTLAQVAQLAEEMGYRAHADVSDSDLVRLMLDDIKDSTPYKVALEERADEIERDRARRFRIILERDGLVGGEEAHTDAHLDYLLADLGVLQEQAKGLIRRQMRRVSKKALQEWARNYVRTKLTAGEGIRYDRLAQMEARAGRLAAAAARKGDLEAAVEHLYQQVHHHALVQESIRARKLVEKVKAKWAGSKLKLGKMSEEYAKTISDIIAFFRINDTTRAPADSDPNRLNLPTDMTGSKDDDALRKNLRYLLPDFTEMPEFILLKQRPESEDGETPYKLTDLTVEQIELINNTLEGLASRGRGDLKAFFEGKKITAAEYAQKILENLRKQQKRWKGEPSKFKTRMRNKFRGLLSTMTRIEQLAELMDDFSVMEGGEMGPMRMIFALASEADSIKINRMQELLKKGVKGLRPLETLLDILGKAGDVWEAKHGGAYGTPEGVPVPKLAKEKLGWEGFTWGRILSVAMNLGNDANYLAVTEGWGFTEKHIEALKQEITDAGGEEVWDAIQEIMDTVNSFYGELNQLNKDLRGREMIKEEAMEFSVPLPGGGRKTLRGGYMPLIYDPDIDPYIADRNERADVLKQAKMQGAYGRSAKPEMGFMQGRKRSDDGEAKVKRAPLLSPAVWINHLDSVVHAITHARVLNDIDLIFRSEGFQDEVADYIGKDGVKQLKKWLNFAAHPQRESTDDWSRAFDKMRGLATVSVLGAKTFTGIRQRLSISSGVNAIAEIFGDIPGARKKATAIWLRACKEYGVKGNLWGSKSSEVLEKIFKHSPLMKARLDSGTFSQELADSLAPLFPGAAMEIKIKNLRLTPQKWKDFVFWWVRANDAAAVVPLWLATFEAAHQYNLGGIHKGMALEEKNSIAARLADGVIRTSQPSAQPTDLTELQRSSGSVRLIAMFLTWQLTYGNRAMMHIYKGKARGKWKDFARFLLMETWLPRAVWMLGSYFLYDDEHKPSALDFLLRPAIDLGAWVPGLSQGLTYLQYGIEPSVPALEGIHRTGQAVEAIGKEIYEAFAGVQGRRHRRSSPQARFRKDSYVFRSDAIYHSWRALEWWFGLPATNIPLDVYKTIDKMGG
jgi:hypothetical protein